MRPVSETVPYGVPEQPLTPLEDQMTQDAAAAVEPDPTAPLHPEDTDNSPKPEDGDQDVSQEPGSAYDPDGSPAS